jgi:hypothetical protein
MLPECITESDALTALRERCEGVASFITDLHAHGAMRRVEGFYRTILRDHLSSLRALIDHIEPKP